MPARTWVAATAAAAVGLFVSASASIAQDKKVRLQVAGAFPSSTGLLGPTQTYLVDTLRKVSGGSIDAKFFEPGALVPASQYFDAVANGSLELGMDRHRLLHRQGHRLRHVRIGAVRP